MMKFFQTRFTQNHFENCYTGVLIGLDNPNRRVEMDQCTFDNNQWAGIATTAGLRLVDNCDFLIPEHGTGTANAAFSGVVTNSSYGIHAYNTGFETKNSRFGPLSGAAKLPGFHTGIYAKNDEGLTSTLTLNSNTFTNLRTAIQLEKEGNGHDNAIFDFTLRCNAFINEEQTNNPITRKGLVIGEGVQLRAPNGTNFNNNAIGGSDGFSSGNAYPNANVWPVDPSVDRTILPVDFSDFPQDVNVEWPNSPNWMPIDNQSTPITYFNFFNEFIWNGTIPGVAKEQAASPDLYSVIRENGQGAINPNLNTVAACGTQFDEVPVLFPTRFAVVDSSANFTGLKINNLEEMLLGEAIPNPADKEARISIILPATVQQAVLQFVSLADGKVLQTQAILPRGSLEALLDVKSASAGVYGYRLIVDGKPVGVKKLVVVK